MGMIYMSSQRTPEGAPDHPDAPDDRWHQAVTGVQSTIERIRHCSDEEKKRLRDDLRDLLSMQEKLSRGQVDIVVFGEISTGKSALINALVGDVVREVNVRGGWTKDVMVTEGGGERRQQKEQL